MRTAIRSLAAVVVAVAVAGSAFADPVAVVGAVEGKATLTPAKGRKGAPVPVSFGAALEPGDLIAVAPRSRATLFFNDGNVIELGAGSSLTIGGRAAAGNAAGGDKLPREAFAAVTNFRISGSRERGLVAAPALRSGEAADRTPEPLAPRSTDVLEDRPGFSWRAVRSATRYSVHVSNDGGELWTADSDHPALAFPAEAAALPEGEYLWEVQAFNGSTPLERASATFRVIPAVQADAVRHVVEQIHASAGGADSPAARYLAGAYLFDRGYLSAAAEQFRALIALAPGSPAPHEALGDVYRAVGLTDLATAAYAKATSLSAAR